MKVEAHVVVIKPVALGIVLHEVDARVALHVEKSSDDGGCERLGVVRHPPHFGVVRVGIGQRAVRYLGDSEWQQQE